MKRRLWLLGVAVCLAGCAVEYRRDAPASHLAFDGVESAVKGVKPVGALTQENDINIKVDRKKSPVITLDGVKGSFELVALEGKKGQEYSIDVVSTCDCAGFRKLILYPIGHLLDAKGTIVSTGKVYSIARVGPIKMLLDGRFPEDGTYYLLIAADNSLQGGTIRKSTLLIMPYIIPLPVRLKAYPEGELLISWAKPKG